MSSNGKRKELTCKDCKHCFKCIEWSRRYPCRDFKLAEPAILERRGRNDSNRKVEQHNHQR